MNREAYLVVFRPDSVNYTPVWDMDPISVSVDLNGLADARDADLIKLVETIIEGEGLDDQAEYVLVWSDTGRPVQTTCANCGDIFRVSDGAVDKNVILCSAAWTHGG